MEWSKNLAKFDSNATGKGIASGEFVVVHSYPDVFMKLKEAEAEKYDYFISS